MKIYSAMRSMHVEESPNSIVLYWDDWDDYHFKTSFDALYVDENSNRIRLGWVKIGKKGLKNGGIIAKYLPKEMDSLAENFFSLGQNREYYEAIAALGDDVRVEILTSLRDISFNLQLFETVENENITRASLLRGINKFSLISQFHRIANGGAALTRYSFSYIPNGYNSPLLTFKVTPNSKPPSNIHVIIGRNGTGKTTLLRNIIHALYCNDDITGHFIYESENDSVFLPAQNGKIVNVICVSFSPFDSFPKNEKELVAGKIRMPYSYIGLDITTNDISEALISQLANAIFLCKANRHKSALLTQTLNNLRSDPAFENSGIIELLNKEELNADEMYELFKTLSSGHKMVLLIALCCVEKIEECSLLVIDEPENHLHPPLLSALIRTLSDLLIDRNGVAIIATHSPVVLQEVPRCCAWTLRRIGEKIISERPSIETFGSNVGSLTSEVFGLEVQKSGFIRLLEDSVNRGLSYDEILDEFDGQLGVEAQMILRGLTYCRNGEYSQ